MSDMSDALDDLVKSITPTPAELAALAEAQARDTITYLRVELGEAKARAERVSGLLDRLIDKLAAAQQECRGADELMVRLMLTNIVLLGLPLALDARTIVNGLEPAPRAGRGLFAVATAGKAGG